MSTTRDRARVGSDAWLGLFFNIGLESKTVANRISLVVEWINETQLLHEIDQLPIFSPRKLITRICFLLGVGIQIPSYEIALHTANGDVRYILREDRSVATHELL